MGKSKQAFKQLLTEFIKRNNLNGQKSLIVFQGFPQEMYQAATELDIIHFSKRDYSHSYVDTNTLDGGVLLRELIVSQGLNFAFYEDLIALSDVLNNLSVYGGNIVIVRNNLFDDFYPIPINVDNTVISNALENESTKDDDSRIRNYYADYKIINNLPWLSFINRHFEMDIGINIPVLDLYSGYSETVSHDNTPEPIEIAKTNYEYFKYQLQIGFLENKQITFNKDFIMQKSELPVIIELACHYGNQITITENEGIATDQNPNEHLNILQKYWGNNAAFRENFFYKNPAMSSDTTRISQGIIVSDVIRQCENVLDSAQTYAYSDVIVTAPTGAGKSIFFQLPGIHLHEKHQAITIVICPLKALMVDQVKELRDRGIDYATFINSDITYEQRQNRQEGIKTGKFSIVYLSPELFLANDIRTIVGERIIGLVVIDEAHLVTSWGRDFRVDYWFLGDYIEKIRRGSQRGKGMPPIVFPVLCLTATAVYGGSDDVIGDLQDSLHLSCDSEHLYIGYIRRSNISFQIRHPIKDKGSDKDKKLELTVKAVCDYVEKGEKTIAYFPFKSQIEDTLHQLRFAHHNTWEKVRHYYGSGLSSMERDRSYSDFRDSSATVMLATKAFGMGVNIHDVVNVYHYAPTGTLADYVQEIGRAARSLEQGYAITDCLPTDMRYARTLWGLSGLRHYQIKEIMKKLYELYKVKGRRNLLFSPETFDYLFGSKDIDMKVKSGLMLLSADLLSTYHFRVINVRPKSLFSRQYISVPSAIEESFLKQYGDYCKQVKDCYELKELAHGYNAEVRRYRHGNVFEINLDRLWEDKFEDKTFAQFKYEFFSGEWFSSSEENEKIVPNMKMVISYDYGYEETKDRFLKFSDALQRTFTGIKRKFGGREFALSDFSDGMCVLYGQKIKREYLQMLLDLFCYDHVDIYDAPKEPWRFIQKRSKTNPKNGITETVYCVRTQRVAHLESNLQRYITQLAPNSEDGTKHTAYLALPVSQTGSRTTPYQQLVASILQLFDFASYDLSGGKNPQIFVRINDPNKLRRIAESNRQYRNSFLTEIEERHVRAIKIMNSFLRNDFTDDERWDIIEDYFLGKDDAVDYKLSLTSENDATKKTVKIKSDTANNTEIVFTKGDTMLEYYSSWEEASELPGTADLASEQIPLATYFCSELQLGSEIIEVRYAWPDYKVVMVENEPTKEMLRAAKAQGWRCLIAEDCDFEELKEYLGV